MRDNREERVAFPYIPNSAPGVRQAMVAAVGATETDELYASIPDELRFKGLLDVPDGLVSEYDLRRYADEALARNTSSAETLSFLGGGCWDHFIPAVCDEIGTRSEFLTGYHDGARSMLGTYQAQFEFQTMLGELVGMEMVSTTTYDWGSSAASSLLMAHRITQRPDVLLPRTTSPTRRRQIETIGAPLNVRAIGYDAASGALDLDELRASLSSSTAAVYIEVPSFLGFLEPGVEEIAELAHGAGALLVVGVDPVSLGVLAAPRSYGADIVCGELQPLGIHMLYGGGMAGFIATPHEEEYITNCPTLLVSILETERPDEYLFDWVNFAQVSYGLRDKAQDFAGTTQTIWAIVAGVYLALMGPAGMRELGQTIMDRTQYAGTALSDVPGVNGSVFGASTFKELVVSFSGTGRSVEAVNGALRERGIFGGSDLGADFPELGASALYRITEKHRKDDIDRLVSELSEVVQ
jgi:glycine dehydrogenase subunit 1